MFRDRKSESALCFVPEILVEFINRNVHRKKSTLEPTSYFIQGVCLLVDISGFTKLSGEYCSQGKGGIDDLQRATNGFMGKLVEIIYQFGGDIVKFAGDAIICVFSSHTGSPLNIRRSIGGVNGLRVSMASILVPQQSMNALPTVSIPSSISPELILRVMRCARVLREVQTDKLTVHVAMSCGEMCFGILGGFENRWECLISGPCIHQLSDCLDDAPSKEAVISPQCAEIIQDVQKTNTVAFGPAHHVPAVFSKVETSLGTYEFQILELPSGNFRILEVHAPSNDMVTLAVSKASPKSIFGVGNSDQQELIRRFVPVPIADELESAASLTYLAEIREVTTMFMKWDSYDAFNANKDLISLQPCFYEAQRILQSSGAYLRQFLVDDKGCVLIACWGMPHLSYLDNSCRAVTAAAQIKHELEKLGMNCSFGITTGDVYCGTVGSVLRMEYAAIGSVVNMSARLMGKAAGGILIDDATYTRLPSTMSEHLLKLDPIKVKGRDEPLQVYKYNTSGSVQVKEKVVGDHELSHMCRNTLLSLVMRMSYAATHSNSLAPPACSCDPSAPEAKPFNGWFSWLQFRRAHSTAGSCFPVVVIQGQEDSGRTIAISWLKSQALDHNLNMHCAKLVSKDTHIEFSMWRKIFTLLMPKDLFLNKTIQRIRVHEILSGIYPCSPKLARTQGFPVLKAVMGLTCSYARDAPTEPDDNSTGSITAHNKVPSIKLRLKPKAVVLDATLPTLETLTQVFAYLLNRQTTLVVVQNIELVDAESMRLLINLMPHVTQSAFVCTALTEAVAQENTVRRGNYFSFFETRTREVGKVTPWTTHLPTLLARDTSTSITLENYTPESVDRMLAEALGVTVVPPEIAQLVRDLSGDSYFWVREILQFIKEHGAEKFVSGVGPEKNDNMSVSMSVSTSRLVGGGMGKGLKRHPTLTDRTPNRTPTRTPNRSPQRSPSSSRVSSSRLKSFIQPSGHRGSSLVQVQLDNLVLCRFESLPSTIQRILRTASIIGITFSYQDLHALLPTHLREQLPACLSVLLQQKWLYQDFEYETQYEFSHPLSHQIIYELTPSSERNNLHQAIGDHIVEHYRDDRSQYAAICYHYQHCDADKALQYVILATHLMLETADIFEYSDGLNLLSSMIVYSKTPQDVCVLQELVNNTRAAIERLDLSIPQTSAHPWLHYLKKWYLGYKSTAILPVEAANKSHKSQKSGKSHNSQKSLRNYNAQSMNSMAFGGSTGSNQNLHNGNLNNNSNNNISNNGAHGKNHSNKSGGHFFGANYSEDTTTTSEVAMEGWTVEQRTQYVLLEQIRALQPQLDERYMTLSEEYGNRVELFTFSNM